MNTDMLKSFKVDRLNVRVFESRSGLGYAAAESVLFYLQECLREKGGARVVFGCAPSQDEFLEALVKLADDAGFDWSTVDIFHMDEYVGLRADQPQSFRNYLKKHLLDFIEPKAFHPIQGDAEDLEGMVAEYADRLAEAPIDLICMGIGENGHIAFNDPPVADFTDPKLVKVIPLDPVCRQQQVNDGCFDDLNSVPETAVTITVPNFINAKRLSCVVPNVRKAEAVRRTLTDPVSTDCPGTIVREHSQAFLFLDKDSASLLGPLLDSEEKIFV